jgi:uncharacterized Tic20 family protein
MLLDLDQRKTFTVLCHSASLINYTGFSVAIPLVLLFTKKDSIVVSNARESVNFHFTMWIFLILGFLLTKILIGFAVIAVVAIASLILSLQAILSLLKDEQQIYHYPFTIRFF